MIRPDPDEQIVARRANGPRAILRGAALTGAGGLALFALLAWAATGGVPLAGLALFVVTFGTLNTLLHLLVRRRIDYCLTDRRLLIAPDREIPLEEISGFDVGAHSLTVRTPDREHRILALGSPAWLATRLNRCRAQAAPDSGKVAA
ncbi:hypothetical protein [Pseudooceanicola sp.]|uniref:hypothetical protein n=1 Tax=Pseudooceanicola sp. TaxID=1914328 RepID=UPI0035C6C0C9